MSSPFTIILLWWRDLSVSVDPKSYVIWSLLLLKLEREETKNGSRALSCAPQYAPCKVP